MVVLAALPVWWRGGSAREARGGVEACRSLRGVQDVGGSSRASNGDCQTHLARFDPEPLRPRDSISSHAITFI